MKKVEIYTDGACSNNPGPGGYGAILIYGKREKVVSGGENNTTNNRMELTAVIKALGALKEKCIVNLYTDSSYVHNAFSQNWIEQWQLNGWKNSNNKPILNKDLWEELLKLTNLHNVNFIKVKGHSDNENNNRCDKIARSEIEKLYKNTN